MSYAIHIAHVQHSLGADFALRDLNMKVPAGAVYGLLGPNGSGKTTTIRLLMGMIRAQQGTVRVLDHDMPAHAHVALAQVGYVPERLHLYPGLTVADTVQYHSAFYTTWDSARATELLGTFDLRAAQVVGAMSKGESGKLLVLLALCQQPALLVLDEPTDGLDPVARRDVLSAVMAHVADTKATVLITSHLVHEIERTCDWVGLLDDGALVIEEPMSAFRDSLRKLRIGGVPTALGALPFELVARRSNGTRAEEWVVRGFPSGGSAWFGDQQMELHDVQPMDLEDTVVELLRAARRPLVAGGAR